VQAAPMSTYCHDREHMRVGTFLFIYRKPEAKFSLGTVREDLTQILTTVRKATPGTSRPVCVRSVHAMTRMSRLVVG
jgi:hypothetical protein